MLISALGADQEDFHRKVARVGSNGFHAHSSIPLTQRTYDIQKNDGNRPFKSTTSNILLSSDEESPTLAVNERNASAFEAKPNVRVPQEGSPSKRHQIVPEVDDDDDDDDDDDEEDEEEDGDWQHA
ncbi:hypothetical protein BGX28_000895 [Mortierella sp. GBA30]|nr:hypothetical protein BGX28_000895 [Mortierella sp. GBA30]